MLGEGAVGILDTVGCMMHEALVIPTNQQCILQHGRLTTIVCVCYTCILASDSCVIASCDCQEYLLAVS